MSTLKVYRPRSLSLFHPQIADWESAPAGEDATEDPVILKFPVMEERIAGRIGPRNPALECDPVQRARILHLNRSCPDCGRGATVPQEADCPSNATGAWSIPGTAPIAGFCCDFCGNQWQV
jgi:hypothetical protein